MMHNERWQWMKDELAQLRDRSQYRTVSDSHVLDDGWLVRGGRKMLNLASNHYLGLPMGLDERRMNELASNDDLGPADIPDELQMNLDVSGNVGGVGSDFGAEDGCGCGFIAGAEGLHIGAAASRLIVGSDPIFSRFEEEFARFKGTESCLLFGSGYTANVGVISALVGRHDVVYSDRLNHASIVDGITLSRAEHMRYRHRDLDHLESMLRKAPEGVKKLIVTDTVFSMDGDIASLEELVRLKEKYDAMLMVDEAHSGGIFGDRGEGLVHALGLTDRVDVVMGTFSKAYGCYGAYIAGDTVLKEYLINKARSFIFTTALPPMVVHAVRANWMRASSESWRRDELRRKADRFRGRLREMGFDTGGSETQIVPLIVGDNERTVRLGESLQDAGIAAVPVRPPTVPEGTARIRFTLMSTHKDEDLDWALDEIELAGKQLGLI